MKQAEPLLLARYTEEHSLTFFPAFAWWVPQTLKRHKYIVNKVDTRYTKTTHKYGIEVPKTIDESLDIDRQTNTTFWHKTIDLEMKNVKVTFNILEDGAKLPPGYIFIRHHMIFDVRRTYVEGLDLWRMALLLIHHPTSLM